MKRLLTTTALAAALCIGPLPGMADAGQRARGGGGGGGRGSGGASTAPSGGGGGHQGSGDSAGRRGGGGEGGERARPRTESPRANPEARAGGTEQRRERGEVRAVPRSQAPDRGRSYGYPSFRTYYPYYPYGAFGLGYFFYDPFWWGSSYSAYGYPAYGGYYGGSGYPGGRSFDTGGLRLKVKPRNAQVMVDGYFVGVVDDYDGMFQRLNLEPGPHRIEVRADGYEPLVFDVRIVEDDTVTYKGELKRPSN
jgi:hypothetical protein